MQVCDVDLENGVLHLAYNYVVVGGRRIRKDTKTHQDRYLPIDPVTCAMLREHLEAIRTELGGLGLELPEDAYVFSNDPMGASPWNPDWATHSLRIAAGRSGRPRPRGRHRRQHPAVDRYDSSRSLRQPRSVAEASRPRSRFRGDDDEPAGLRRAPRPP